MSRSLEHLGTSSGLNRSPKGNMWSGIPVALLCMILNLSERKQGSGPKGDKVLQNTGDFCSSVIPSVRLKPERANRGFERAYLSPERSDWRVERLDWRLDD